MSANTGRVKAVKALKALVIKYKCNTLGSVTVYQKIVKINLQQFGLTLLLS